MTRSEPMAEARAGGNETQDSQAILDDLRAELGVGTVTSSSDTGQLDPGKGDAHSRRSTPAELQKYSSHLAAGSEEYGALVAEPEARLQIPDEQATRHEARNDDCQRTDHSTNQPEFTTERRESSVSQKPSDDTGLVPDTPRHDSQPASQHDAVQHVLRHSDQLPSASAGRAPPSKKMDVSQQSPTQVNEDRDYNEQFCDPLPSSPAHDDHDDHYERTLQPEDTGAVNFGNLSEIGRPSSQISEDGGFENTRGDWRIPNNTSQLLSSHAITPYKPYGAAPETPALPMNPFGTKPGIAAPFGGTQMFGQTQLSSAMKRISPTSSRPSPNIFYNSISPNIMETSPLKNRANVSSPTDIRTSSPQRLHEVPGTVRRMRQGDPVPPEDTPSNSKSTKDDMIPESPTYRKPRSSESREPLAHYEPMKKSQERKAHDDVPLLSIGSDESDADDAVKQIKKRKLIERKRAQAAQEMEKVSFTPSSVRESGEQPSRKKRRLLSDGENNTVPRHAPGNPDPARNREPSTEVRSSLKGTATPSDVVAESSEGAPGKVLDKTRQADADDRTVMGMNPEKLMEEDMIPATSPVQLSSADQPNLPLASEPELPHLLVGAVGSPPGGSVTETSSLPPPRRRAQATYGKKSRQTRRSTVVTSSAPDVLPPNIEDGSDRDPPEPHVLDRTAALGSPSNGEPETPAQELAEEAGVDGETNEARNISPQTSRLESSAPVHTQTRRSKRKPFTPLQPRIKDGAADTSSSLTVLSTTPVPSSKTTPATQDSPASKRTGSAHPPSPAVGRNLRKRSLRVRARSESPQPVNRFMRTAKRTPRLDSESTDELHHTPPASALERSMGQPKASRSVKYSFGPSHRAGRLFNGMAFALSFQSSQAKQQERTKLEAKISQAGGLILAEGFQELFEHSATMTPTSPVFDDDETLKLTKTGVESGFTALIADGHSRKAKYMQALALGLPCLAPQWITACLNKEMIVDWEPYLLCAGSSAVLGDAVRSRNLPTYPANEARLMDVVDGRARLLEGQSILVVVDSKKARSEAKQPYIFLAQALGPSVSRVFTTQQARDALRDYEQAGRPFDWLYIDKATGTAESVLSAPETGTKKSRKRTASAVHLNVNTRVLNDELVIQSLILGRMVDEEEMSF